MDRKEYYMEMTEPIGLVYNCITKASNNPFHFHDNYEIYIFLSGDVDCFIEQSCYRLERGHLIVFNDREIHRVCYYGELPYERRVLHISPKIIQSLSTDKSNLLNCFENRKLGANNIVLLQEQLLNEILDMFEKLKYITSSSPYGSDVLSNAYLSILLALINKAFHENHDIAPISATRSHNLIPDILSFIDSSIGQNLSLQMIARHFSIDRYYLCHIFKEKTGTSLYQYILLKKISLAKYYLTERKSVTEVCTLSGFNDYSNFIRTFKKVTGVSPGKYASRQ